MLDYNSKEQKGIVIRPRVVMGPGRMGIFDLLFNAIYKSNLIPIIGMGKNRFQFTDVRDLSEVIVKFIGIGKGGVYNVGCDTKLNVHQLLTQSIKSVGSGSKILITPSWPIKLALTIFNKLNISPLMEEQYNIANLDFVLDTTKVKSELDWQPKHTDVECLVNAYNWWVKEKKNMSRDNLRKNLGYSENLKHLIRVVFKKANERKGLLTNCIAVLAFILALNLLLKINETSPIVASFAIVKTSSSFIVILILGVLAASFCELKDYTKR